MEVVKVIEVLIDNPLEESMPIRKRKLSQAEAREYRTRLSRLKRMGVEVGCEGGFLQEPDRLRKGLKLVQVDEALAKIYDLPGNGTIAFLPAKLIVVPSKIVIADFEVAAPWDELPFNLDDPEGGTFYPDLIAGWYNLPLTILNPWLTGESALRRGQREGVIIARGQRSVPSKYHDHTVLTVELSLRDDRNDELRFTFRGRVDRSLRRKYERQQQERLKGARLTGRVPIFKRENEQAGDEMGFSPEEAAKPMHANNERDAAKGARSSETKLEGA
jgi:hypothetical protein